MYTNGESTIITSRNKAVDGLRGIVALIIALFHIESYVPFGEDKIFVTGYLGVEFFFILSGFLLVKGYISKIERGKFSIKETLKNKVVRLFPAYLFALVAQIMLYSFFWFNGNLFAWINSDKFHLQSTLKEVFALQALGIGGFRYINYPAWYVSALLFTIVIITILLKVFGKKYIQILSPIIAIVSYFFIFYTKNYSAPESYIFDIVPTNIVRAMAGMNLGVFVWNMYMKFKDKLSKLSYISISLLEGILIVSFLKMLLHNKTTDYNYLILIPIIGIILMMFSIQGAVSKILSTNVCVFMGNISYSFYLMQSFCSNLVLNILYDKPAFVKVAIYLIINIVIAYFLHEVVEKRVTSLLKRNRVGCIIFALCISFWLLVLLSNYKVSTAESGDTIQIQALDEKNIAAEATEIWIKNVLVDGKVYSVDEIFAQDWMRDEEKIGWRAYNQPDNMQDTLSGCIPYGKNRSIIFEVNKWQGKAKIFFMGEVIEIDCFKDCESDQIDVQLKANIGQNKVRHTSQFKKEIVMWNLTILIIVIICIQIYWINNEKKVKNIRIKADRKIWIDVLRIFCMVNVVFLHATCDGYNTTFGNALNWNNYLYLNSLTACAVPIFFMISGNLIIHEEKNYIGSVIRRIKKIIIPLLGWSIIYIFVRKWYLAENINIFKQIIKVASEPQYAHLWFIYTLCGVYIMSPVISYIYYHADKKLLTYLLTVFGILPMVLKTFNMGINYNINLPILYSFFPEVMLFILGKLLIDNSSKLFKKWYIWAGLAFMGYGMVVLVAYYASLKTAIPNKTAFSDYGTLPVFIMYVSIYMTFYLLHDFWSKIGKKQKWIIFMISDSCMDIYFVHMLVYVFLEGKSLLGICNLSIHSRSIKTGFITALLCFAISFLVSVLMHKIGLLIKKLGYKNL